jgi:Polyketide cyclase / dehydrase and lipid transport
VIIRIVIIVAVAIAAVLAFLVIFAATRPDTLRVQRSVTIDAAPEKIFPLIDDFHNWPGWAPQDREDPSMKRTYSGAAFGTGAVSDWAGSGSAGKGRMSITESTPATRVVVKVDFVKPFAAHNINEFILEPMLGPATKVTWTMQGSNLYVMKLMSTFVNMDRVMGKHFESGLSNLKKAAENRP